MFKKNFIFIGIILLIALNTCKSTQVNTDYDPLFLNCWKHAREEDNAGVQVYRPCDYQDFPISRYRQNLTLFEDGKASFSILSPTDRHINEEGTWIYSKKEKSLTIKNKQGKRLWNFEVKDLTKDKMRLKIE